MFLNHENPQDVLKTVLKSLLLFLIFATIVLNVCLLVPHLMSLIILVKRYRNKLPNSGIL